MVDFPYEITRLVMQKLPIKVLSKLLLKSEPADAVIPTSLREKLQSMSLPELIDSTKDMDEETKNFCDNLLKEKLQEVCPWFEPQYSHRETWRECAIEYLKRMSLKQPERDQFQFNFFPNSHIPKPHAVWSPGSNDVNVEAFGGYSFDVLSGEVEKEYREFDDRNGSDVDSDDNDPEAVGENRDHLGNRRQNHDMFTSLDNLGRRYRVSDFVPTVVTSTHYISAYDICVRLDSLKPSLDNPVNLYMISLPDVLIVLKRDSESDRRGRYYAEVMIKLKSSPSDGPFDATRRFLRDPMHPQRMFWVYALGSHTFVFCDDGRQDKRTNKAGLLWYVFDGVRKPLELGPIDFKNMIIQDGLIHLAGIGSYHCIQTKIGPEFGTRHEEYCSNYGHSEDSITFTGHYKEEHWRKLWPVGGLS